LLVAGSAPVLAQDSGGDNTAVAVNTKDGSSIFKLAFGVHRTTSDVIDESNAAVAYASCEDCRTIAVAIQVVLVMSDPSVVTPENVALAVNESCVSCETLASAYQYVLGTDGVVRFDAEGNQQLAEIRRALIELSQSADSLTLDEVQAEIDSIVEGLYTVLDDHLIAVGPAKDADAGVETGEPQPSATPADDPSPTTAAEPSYSPDPSPSSETGTESPDPEPSPTSASSSPEPEPEPSGSP
jgi:putative peptide zinc metalloprotease protein